ncbi:MAG: TetR/AcrR family transcriptional regulator [Pseudomonadota bacterium]
MEIESSERLGPDAWVDAAYAAFEAGGVTAVRVDPLAKSMGITRGSFYWHFKDRGALLRAVIARWDTINTDEAIAENEAQGGTPADRLLRLLRSCATDDGRFEMGIRAWAAEDEEVRRRVAGIDTRRLNYMADLIEQTGVERETALKRARVGYVAWLGTYVGAAFDETAQRLADMDCLWRMMLVKDR